MRCIWRKGQSAASWRYEQMDKLDIEELVVSYKAFPDEAHAEEVIKAMEPLIKYWCRSQCYIPREKEDMLQVARIKAFVLKPMPTAQSAAN